MSSPFKLWADAKDKNTARPYNLLGAGDKPGTSKVPFKVADHKTYLESIRAHRVRKLADNAPLEKIRLRDLNAIQETINDERVAAHNAGGVYKEGARGAGHGGLVDKPLVVKVGGKLYLHDGHHRATAAHLRGESRIEARLVDLDAIPQTIPDESS